MTKDDDAQQQKQDETTATATEPQQHQEQQHWSSIADRLNPNRPAFDPDFQNHWKTLSKAARKKLLKQDRAKIRALKARGAQATASLPFDANDDDHCETSPTAYAHIVPLLELIAQQLEKPPAELRIYDPYYCAGGTVQHLAKLGFPKVYNQPRDFYEAISSGDIPEHDVLVTNPPYSGDHLDKLLLFLQDNNHPKPFLLLLPTAFGGKPAYQKATCLQKDMVFMTPPERYHYWTPEGMRSKKEEDEDPSLAVPTQKRKTKKSSAHRNLHLGTRLSPYSSHWFICLQPLLAKKKVLKLYNRGKLTLVEGCQLQGEPVLIGEAELQLFQSTNKTTNIQKDNDNKGKDEDDDNRERGRSLQEEDPTKGQRKKKKRKT